MEIFEMLKVSAIKRVDKDMLLLPFSAKAASLYYRINQDHIRPGDFNSLKIVTSDLTVVIQPGERHDELDAPLLTSFFGQVTNLGHFERFTLAVDLYRKWWYFDWTYDVTPIADAVIRTINANPNLVFLNLGDTYTSVNWTHHLENIFRSMEQHESLRAFVVPGKCKSDYGVPDDAWWTEDGSDLPSQLFDYSWLERLLSRNRNIDVLDSSGNRCCNGSTIDKIYALNDLYRGSPNLVKESASVRPSLVAMALTGNASANFQHTTLLLSEHTDMLCEFLYMYCANGNDDPVSLVPTPQRSNRTYSLKRKATAQSPRAAKKGAI